MKRTLLALTFLASLAAVSVQATRFWYDPISEYPQGGLTTNSTVGSPGGPNTLWWPKPPGSTTAHDLLVTNLTYTNGAAVNGNRLRVSGSATEYVQRWLNATNGVITNDFGSGALYASFIVNASVIPNPPSARGGTYFACFNGGAGMTPPDSTNGFQFVGRVYEIATTNTYPYTNAFPSSYLIGVANADGDPAQTTPGPWGVVPVEMAQNVDYQVVLRYDFNLDAATVWVNPASEGDTVNSVGPAGDTSIFTNNLAAFLLRQRTGGGVMNLRDIAVGDSFADVMTNTTPGPVWVAMQTGNITNYSGNPAFMAVAASCIGSGQNLNYTWQQVGVGPRGGNSSKLYLPSLAGSDTGYYYCAVTNSAGRGALSGTNYLSVNTASQAPVISPRLPGTTNVQVGQTLTLSVGASGTGPLSYVWTCNNNPLTDGSPVTANAGDNSVVSGSHTPTLVVVGTSKFDGGFYKVTVTGGVAPAASSICSAAVNAVKAVNIAYIRSLEDPVSWQVTDTTSIFTISNAVVTTYTNVTTGTTTSYYIADATGGLDLFVTGDNTFRPQMGDILSVSGTLSSYFNGIEVNITTSNPYEFYVNVGHTNNFPVSPIVFGNFAILTNNVGYMQTNVMGKICMLTNVWFTNGVPFNTGSTYPGYSAYATNAGSPAQIAVYFRSDLDLDVSNQTIQPFAYTITGVMWQNSSANPNDGSGSELIVTRLGDVVTSPPPPVTNLTAKLSANDVVLSWTAVPYLPDNTKPGAYAYSVHSATSLGGPWQSLVTGVAFNTPNGTYTDKNALLGSSQKFYRISSP